MIKVMKRKGRGIKERRDDRQGGRGEERKRGERGRKGGQGRDWGERRGTKSEPNTWQYRLEIHHLII